MCVRCATADRLALVADARDVADALLGRYLRLDVAKTMVSVRLSMSGTECNLETGFRRAARCSEEGTQDVKEKRRGLLARIGEAFQ